ncbi:NAD(+) kinase [Endozoicomonas ascidiicola]|uniref:NAD(+) kinase n=1 Tax=Endozoicomonas ascidiicola TaxID=1698521 RepID=UPI00082CB736|nr:NAD(+) kinase [Endozoicomonas ascidiicola]
MEHFKNVGVTGRQGRIHVEDTLRHLADFLQKRGVNVLLDQQLDSLIPGHVFPMVSREEMGKQCDLVIVVGGDGSMLGAARDLAAYDIPVIGINRGRLGFLTDISPDELDDQLTEVLEGRYLAESRFLLEARVRRKGKVIGQGDALNDVVLHPGKSTRIIEFELYIDGQFVYKQRADGLIIATPTGSTAYALSGGGPIMHPRLDAIVLVPMYPHMLTNRPLVVDGDSELKLVIREENSIYPQVSCDGQIHITSAPGDEITIHKKSQRLKLLHPLNHNFYESCRSKLRWNYQEDRC